MKDTTRVPGTEPTTVSGHEGVDPSSPTRGTEGYGTTPDEKRNVGESSLGASQEEGIAADMRRRADEMSQRSESANTSSGDRTFRCADVGNVDCQWEVSGRTNEELMPQIERHGREHHGITSWDDKLKSRVQHAIRERKAA
jgi:predicted small metal-binding protein